MSAIGPDPPPETNPNEVEHRGQLARSARSASERLDSAEARLDAAETRLDDVESRLFDVEGRLDVVEAIVFTREYTISVRNNQDREITQTTVSGDVVSIRYFANDGAVDTEFQIDGVAVTTSPASPITVTPGAWVPVTATGNNSFSVGSDFSVRTTNGSNNDELVVSITIDNPGTT